MPISESLAEKYESKVPSVYLDNIAAYLKKAIWQYEHWQEVKDSEEQDFLFEVMARADLNEYYVPTYCTDKNKKSFLLDDLFKAFLQDNTKSFLTLLGDFGTGKSSFSLYYYIRLARQYLKNQNSHIPIFISLKDYNGRLNIEEFVVKEFYEKFQIEISFRIFQDLALQGKFVFFVDGFDEMASLADHELTEKNFKELTKLSFENVLFMTDDCEKSQTTNKVFLTSRTHYFYSEIHEKEILKADYTILYRNYATKSDYEITRIHLKQFNDEQIEEYVFKNTKNEQTTNKILKTIKSTYNLQELSTRPLLLEMIVKTIQTLTNKSEINTYVLYQTYTEQWIYRDDWRSQMKPEGKRALMWDLALKMFRKGGDFALYYSELNKPKKEHLKASFEIIGDDYYKYETMTCSFLNRDKEGNYKFIHKSLMEYFLAEYFFHTIKRKEKRIIRPSELNRETEYFLKLAISLEKSNLKSLDLSGLNLNRIDLKEAKLNGANLIRANLEDTFLGGASLIGANLGRANLGGANLGGANLEDANLVEANLVWANLVGANLIRTNFMKAYLGGANLEKANLGGANLDNTYLVRANLRRANLRRANFVGANLRRAILEGAILKDATLRGANYLP
ncbi:pentapeptide repeat-containing protein [Desulfococcaceae bacterium HSG9]|nr:pentapeptide repeat-containing protein [Desulfococcaceae bacterium HSG9]